MIKKLKLYILIIIILVLNSCIYYNYSTEKDPKKNTGFYTTYLSKETDYGTLYVSFHHLYRTYNDPKYKSYINISLKNTKKNIDIKIKHIEMKHYYKDKLLPVKNKSFTVNCNNFNQVFLNDEQIFNESSVNEFPLNFRSADENFIMYINYNQNYDKRFRYKTLKEEIRIDFEINDQKYEINETYDLYYKYWSDYLSVLLSK